MKIAIACCGLGHVRRGIEVWAADLAGALNERGIDVTLFKGGGSVDTTHEVVVPCIHRDSVTARLFTGWPLRGMWRTPFASSYGLESYTFARRLIRYLGDAYDVVHLQDPLVADYLRVANEKGKIHTDVVLANGTEEDAEFLAKFKYLQELDSYGETHSNPPEADQCPLVGTDLRAVRRRRRAQRSRPTMPLTAKEAANIGDGSGSGRDQGRFVVPNFVDTERFKLGDRQAARLALGLPEDAYIVLSVGAVQRQLKRTDYLIQEFGRFREQYKGKALLVIAGARTQESDKLIALAANCIGDDFLIMENVNHTEMPRLYQAADVFAFCVVHGIYGIALAEAAATGLPCIVHDWKRVKWVAGPMATVIDMQQDGNLAAAMMELADGERRATISGATRQWAEAELAKDKVIERYIGMYREIVGETQLPTPQELNHSHPISHPMAW